MSVGAARRLGRCQEQPKGNTSFHFVLCSRHAVRACFPSPINCEAPNVPLSCKPAEQVPGNAGRAATRLSDPTGCSVALRV